jgi:hypothetical protein
MRPAILFPLCLIIYGCPGAQTRPPLEGKYEVQLIKEGASTPTKIYPPGTPKGFALELEITNKRYRLGNAMSSFEGEVVEISPSQVRFIMLENPSGKVEPPKEELFERSNDGQMLTQIAPKTKRRIVYVRNN